MTNLRRSAMNFGAALLVVASTEFAIANDAPAWIRLVNLALAVVVLAVHVLEL